ncbi:MAG: rRNA maturation RNase YbeY [Salinivirgaceae bacterium]|jgi:probable rRNA maturation factor|nr:rRNA maturation RNase YbeY [Salinivirgaceae bacterium]
MIEFLSADISHGICTASFDRIKKWINESIINEGYELGDINIINCSDSYLLDMNREHLNHDFYTDIITFDYVEDKVVSGDLFISEDRIIDNANSFNVSKEDEFLRVVIHGILHLCGYKDKTEEEAQLMRSKENYYIKEYSHVTEV